ncbi:MAG: hypothetical protein AVDCRST_MAG68-356 [uncultured Gemmatimonadetes bacterium]|uniref:DUF1003 domain-containing protein n=1 Tax=uncultured Gemmatimonadota bacterium TaxID=203437 RepID=A0A6J4KBF7_9BACT|nr:MAG: hypothetical protein AVDCRST_MAG68-356 [uncultured Gemmatimonadota bacterium]
MKRAQSGTTGDPPVPPRQMPDARATPLVSDVVDRNIVALLSRREQQRAEQGTTDRISGAVTAFTGRMLLVYLHLAIFGSWIVVNLGWTQIRPFDPSFVILAMIASVEGIFLSAFVLIAQNRLQAAADERADLDLQASLLAEHEITRLVVLVREIARRMNVDVARDPELDELAQDVAPEKLLDRMDAHARHLN